MGGGPTFGKNSQIMSFFFLRAYLKTFSEIGEVNSANVQGSFLKLAQREVEGYRLFDPSVEVVGSGE